METTANETLYLNNLNEKIKIDGKPVNPVLKTSLFHLFTQFGEILEIHAKSNLRMKGQAFVVFKDKQSSSLARATLNGFVFFGKPMVSSIT